MSDNKQGQSVVKFKPGDHLIRTGQAGTHLFIIKSGQLEVYKTDKQGQKLPLAIIGSGEYVGETAVLLDDNYSSSVVALTDVEAIQLSKKIIDAQLKQVPTWLVALTRGLIDRLRKSNEALRKHDLRDDGLENQLRAIETNTANKKASGS
ncbi:MAG: cyclic nucleotide-binding domain-containing protein [Bdellovibrionales bacterium]|nr:cyclic nucleotide-binding domain-containing protein [Bdellovibrionales bacterium]